MLIVLEGLDGAGKSTQMYMIENYFKKMDRTVRLLHFPRFDAPVFGDLISRFLRGDLGKIDEVHPLLVALLFAGDRHDAAPLIKGWLEKGDIVILDRYVYSNIAFQCAKAHDQHEEEMVRDWIIDTEFRHFAIPKPDLNLFLDVPIDFIFQKLNEVRVGAERKYLQGKTDIHEADIFFQKRVRDIYLAQCKLDSSFIRIDCSGVSGEMLDAGAIFELILKQIEKKC